MFDLVIIDRSCSRFPLPSWCRTYESNWLAGSVSASMRSVSQLSTFDRPFSTEYGRRLGTAAIAGNTLTSGGRQPGSPICFSVFWDLSDP